MKVLILDDDPFALSMLSAQLSALKARERGFGDIIACATGDEAVSRLAAADGGIGLVLCDLQMPGMDGVEFVRRLVELGYPGGLVLVSGEDPRTIQAAAMLARSHQLQVLGAIQKPISLQELDRLLDAACAEPRQALRPMRSHAPEDLKTAIATGALVNHYQPKVSMSSGEMLGVEALVRWQHPQHGLVMPGEFIPMAEETGLVTEVGRCVMETALRDLRRWHLDGRGWDVAVNVSTRSFSDLDFPDVLAAQAMRLQAPLENVVLEITESQMASDPQLQLDILTRLRLKRVRLSIDDFGTGYSFLSHLRELPVEELKIDRGFVHGAARDPQLGAIVDANIRLARELGFRVVAEGVEDIDDWRFLQAVGCGFAQGYFIARPMPAADLETWVQAWGERVSDLTLVA